MKDTPIQWCDSTINGSSGCDGCELWNEITRTCYAGNTHENRLAKSLPELYAEDFHEVRMIPGRFAQAAAWSDLRGKDRPGKPWLNGRPRHIFVGDMGDFLSEAVTDEFLERELLSAILSEAGKRHFWMLLTKRPKRLAELSKKWGGLPRNVMALTTVTNQRTADVRIPDLLSVQCYWRGISAEPLLEAITPWLRCELDTDGDGNCHVHRAGCPPKIDWISCGGESGANARWLSANSARGLRDQCQTAKVQFFFKQWGQYVPGTQLTEEVHRRIYGNAPGIEYQMWRVHKKDAGRLLDGREWNEMPEVTL